MCCNETVLLKKLHLALEYIIFRGLILHMILIFDIRLIDNVHAEIMAAKVVFLLHLFEFGC